MKNITYPKTAIGRNIYSRRMAAQMSQEQLAAVLSISPAAVSKWERNLSNPSIEMLWVLADLFECSIDELAGRTHTQAEKTENCDQKRLRLAATGEDLLKCSEIREAKGLRAMEAYVPKLRSGSRFLAFAIPYTLNLYMKQLDLEEVFRLLDNYASSLPDSERLEGSMITSVLQKIYTGESPDLLQEEIASYIGIDYREKNSRMSEILNHTRQEILSSCKDKNMYSNNTDLLEEFIYAGDFEIQSILRNIDTLTLTTALAGASGETASVFMSNLSDRMLYSIHAAMKQWNGTEEEIISAQKKVLELGNFCPNNKI